MITNLITGLSLLLWLAAIAAQDWKSRRIPNWLTFPAIALGVGWFAFTHQALVGSVAGFSILGADFWGTVDGFAGVPAGLLLALLLGLPGFLMRSFGGGDVKLLLALAALGGPVAVILAVLAAAVVACVLLLLRIVPRGAVRKLPYGVYTLPGTCLWVLLA